MGEHGPVRVYLRTLGCPKNDADSHALSHRFRSRGIPLTDDPEHATHVVINTCGFTQDAKEESIAAVFEALSDYPEARVAVMGCLVERYRRELEEGIPEVAGWYGLGDVPALLEEITGPVEPVEQGEQAFQSVEDQAWSSEPLSYGYVKVSDGCDHRCAFCAIPLIKGPYKPVAVQEILDSVALYLDEGARELVLVGQDTALWKSAEMSLTGLVDRIAADPRVTWIRLMYLQPENVTQELLEVIAFHPKVARYLDVPFQHASERVLRRMGRSGDGSSYLRFLARARELMPDVSVRSTFIVGYPGETEEDFEALLDFARAASFDHAGAFVFSPEEGTVAARLRPVVAKKTAIARLNLLSDVLRESAERTNLGLVGSALDVMVDTVAPDEGWPEGVVAQGRSFRQAPEIDGVCYLAGPAPAGLFPGKLVQADIEEALGYDLLVRSHATP